MLSVFDDTICNSDYTFKKTPPSPLFHNYVSFVVKTKDKLCPRSYPHSQPIFPHRILDYEKSSLDFGPTGEYKPAEKIINHSKATRSESKTPGLGETKSSKCKGEAYQDSEDETDQSNIEQESLEDNEKNLKKRLHKMALEGIYKSTTRQATEECALLVPSRPPAMPQILGKNEERELYHSVYKRNGTWKTKVVPEYWDCSQMRPLYETSKRSILSSSSSKSRPSVRSQNPKKEVTFSRKGGNVGRLEDRNQETTHVRPTPGYGGFIPRLPALSSPTRDPRLARSSSAATYRYYPNSTELKILEFAHKGPLSKLVTTTRPCNPFKKGASFTDHILVH